MSWSASDSKVTLHKTQTLTNANICLSDHANDYCALSQESKPVPDGQDPAEAPKTPALWMCYAGGVGFGGYGGYNQYHRRVRLFEVDTNEARIKTWKRLEYGDIEMRVDEQIIVDGGKPIDLPETKQRSRRRI